MHRVRILQQAAEEAIEAAAWYEQERAGLGADFSQAIDFAFVPEEGTIPLTRMPGIGGGAAPKGLFSSASPTILSCGNSPKKSL